MGARVAGVRQCLGGLAAIASLAACGPGNPAPLSLSPLPSQPFCASPETASKCDDLQEVRSRLARFPGLPPRVANEIITIQSWNLDSTLEVESYCFPDGSPLRSLAYVLATRSQWSDTTLWLLQRAGSSWRALPAIEIVQPRYWESAPPSLEFRCWDRFTAVVVPAPWGRGTGFFGLGESWYLLGEGDLKQVLSIPLEYHRVGWGPLHDVVYRGRLSLESGHLGPTRAIVHARVEYSRGDSYREDPILGPLGTLVQTDMDIAFTWNADRREFVPERPDLASALWEAFDTSPQEIVKVHSGPLLRLASKASRRERAWLELFLEDAGAGENADRVRAELASKAPRVSTYENPRFRYEVSLPSTWDLEEPDNGAGVSVVVPGWTEVKLGVWGEHNIWDISDLEGLRRFHEDRLQADPAGTGVAIEVGGLRGWEWESSAEGRWRLHRVLLSGEFTYGLVVEAPAEDHARALQAYQHLCSGFRIVR